MKKWSEIKQATLNKLFLDEEEAQQQGYLNKFQQFANECLSVIANGVKPRIATFKVTVDEENSIVDMPEDFLSFADMINYLDGDVAPKIVFIGDRQLMLSEKGNYIIYYNALWNDITKEDISKDVVLKIDASILNCLPTYIASQALAQDDIQRSTSLKNDFELMLARLDTNVMFEQDHYKSTGGWY